MATCNGKRKACLSKRRFPYQRQLKVRKSQWEYQGCLLYRAHSHHVPPPVPWLQVKGYWLNDAGFTIDTPVKVMVSKGCIILAACS